MKPIYGIKHSLKRDAKGKVTGHETVWLTQYGETIEYNPDYRKSSVLPGSRRLSLNWINIWYDFPEIRELFSNVISLRRWAAHQGLGTRDIETIISQRKRQIAAENGRFY